jgi:hypothetical protein
MWAGKHGGTPFRIEEERTAQGSEDRFTDHEHDEELPNLPRNARCYRLTGQTGQRFTALRRTDEEMNLEGLDWLLRALGVDEHRWDRVLGTPISRGAVDRLAEEITARILRDHSQNP